MKGALGRHMWHPDRGRFARMAVPLPDGSYRLDMTADSSSYALFAFGAFEPDDPRIVAQMTQDFERLWIKTPIGGCARYERDYYHQIERDKIDQVPGNPWVICTLWHAQWRIAAARNLDELRKALPLLEWAATRALPSGVLAEQFHPHTGEPMSVSPLTWSHATYCMVVVEYLRRYESMSRQRSAGRIEMA